MYSDGRLLCCSIQAFNSQDMMQEAALTVKLLTSEFDIQQYSFLKAHQQLEKAHRIAGAHLLIENYHPNNNSLTKLEIESLCHNQNEMTFG